jgi:hypothetical protein
LVKGLFLAGDALNEHARFWAIPSGAATVTVAAFLQTSPTIAHGHLNVIVAAALKFHHKNRSVFSWESRSHGIVDAGTCRPKLLPIQ